MEAPEYLPTGFYRAGNSHCVPEKDAGGGGDQFAVEDLLDFSKEEEEEGGEEEEEEFGWVAVAGSDEGRSDGAVGNSTDSSTITAVDSCSNSLSGFEQHYPNGLAFGSIPDGASLSDDLCEPQYDELAELEMAVSNFEDSFSSEDLHKLHLINGVNSASSSSSSSATVAAAGRLAEDSVGGGEKQVTTFRPEAPVPGKARSKRSRVAPCNWSSRLLAVSHSAFVSPSPDSELIAPPGSGAPPQKAAKRKEPAGLASADGRRCVHCQTDKTPQWRTGPMGPKTLCNACGVRFKSGRLVPEYRPAASPTFVVSQHSNSHRKVLELRRQKELDQLAAPPAGPAALFDTLPPIPPAAFLIHGPDIRRLI